MPPSVGRCMPIAHGVLHQCEQQRRLQGAYDRAFLVGLKMLSELLTDMPGGHPGCLIVRLFDHEVQSLNATVLAWRKRFGPRLDLIATRYPPRIAIDLDDVADMHRSLPVESHQGQRRIVAAGMLYRDFVRTIFLGA